MTKEEIDQYREKIDLQLKEKVTEIESNVAFIIVGSLGFFLTINEKFIVLVNSKVKWALFSSIILLIVSFIFYLINKHLTTKFDRKIITFLDDEMKPDNIESNTKLMIMWKKYDGILMCNLNIIYILLGLGIIFETFFFVKNIMENEHSKINIENLPQKTTNKIDTFKINNNVK